VQQDGPALIQGMSERRGRMDPLQPVRRKIERFKAGRRCSHRVDRRAQVVEKAGESECESPGAPADRIRTFENSRFTTRARHNDGSGQTVGSGTDHGRAFFRGGRQPHAILEEMQKRRLGNSDMELTPVGVGAWAMGGGGWAFAWGPQDDAESIQAIHAALDRGVNWIDTAAVYGLGHSEEVVARALEGRSDRPYVFTKCERVWDENGRISKSNVTSVEFHRPPFLRALTRNS